MARLRSPPTLGRSYPSLYLRSSLKFHPLAEQQPVVGHTFHFYYERRYNDAREQAEWVLIRE